MHPGSLEKGRTPSKPGIFALVCVLVYLALAVPALLSHALWRDEAEIWCVARDAPSVGALYAINHVAGHADLYYLVLRLLSHISRFPVAMQWLNLSLVAGTVFIVARYSPLTPSQKLLFGLGYFPLFEYGTLCRDYAFGILLLVSTVVAWQSGRARRKWFLLLLFLTTQTTHYCLILVAALLATEFFEGTPPGRPTSRFTVAATTRPERWKRAWEAIIGRAREQWPAFWPGALLLIIGVFWFGVQAIPPRQSFWIAPPPHHPTGFQALVRAVGGVWTGLIPIPALTLRFWNSNILSDPLLLPRGQLLGGSAVESAATGPWAPLAGVTLLLLLFLAFRRCRPALLFLTVAIFPMLALNTAGEYRNTIYLRHTGHFFILLLFATWVARLYTASCTQNGVDRGPGMATWWNARIHLDSTTVLSGVLVIQAIVGVFAVSVSFCVPFSGGRAAARFLQSRRLDDARMVGNYDFSAQTVAAYLDRSLDYVWAERRGTYVVWSRRSRSAPPESKVLTWCDRDALDGRGAAILVSSLPVSSNATPGGRLVSLLEKFPDTIAPDEGIWLYRIAYSPAERDPDR